ncbi:MAG: DUF167 family protein [Sandaracinaceae bacterium]|nr:DUF167 family protein [Sandaracinaceae bacterium]
MHVSPRASRDAIGGLHDGALKITITAPPVDGEANAAIVKLLAKRLGVAKRDVVIARGETGRRKTIEVLGVSAEAVRALAQ